LITANAGNPRGLQPEELYDLKTDPGEQRSLVASEPAMLEELRAALGRSYLEARAHAGAGAQTDVDSVTKDRLRALGYLKGCTCRERATAGDRARRGDAGPGGALGSQR